MDWVTTPTQEHKDLEGGGVFFVSPRRGREFSSMSVVAAFGSGGNCHASTQTLCYGIREMTAEVTNRDPDKDHPII